MVRSWPQAKANSYWKKSRNLQTNRLNQTISPTVNRLRNEPYRPRSSLGSSLSRSTPQLVETALRTPRRKEIRRTMESPAPAKITRPLNDDINYTPRKSSSRIRPAKSTSNLSAVSTESKAKQRRKRLKPDVRVEITLHLKLIILTNKKTNKSDYQPDQANRKGWTFAIKITGKSISKVRFAGSKRFRSTILDQAE